MCARAVLILLALASRASTAGSQRLGLKEQQLVERASPPQKLLSSLLLAQVNPAYLRHRAHLPTRAPPQVAIDKEDKRDKFEQDIAKVDKLVTGGEEGKLANMSFDERLQYLKARGDAQATPITKKENEAKKKMKAVDPRRVFYGWGQVGNPAQFIDDLQNDFTDVKYPSRKRIIFMAPATFGMYFLWETWCWFLSFAMNPVSTYIYWPEQFDLRYSVEELLLGVRYWAQPLFAWKNLVLKKRRRQNRRRNREKRLDELRAKGITPTAAELRPARQQKKTGNFVVDILNEFVR
jgi:hypothetical protein